MNILYEEDGSFKVGSIMADNTTSFQIESVSGKRSKVKAANVMLHFSQPALAEFIAQAEAIAGGIEADFLWECCPPDEFGFEQIAAEYFVHAPNPLEAAAALIRLHGAPIYFHKKGKGRYRAAPPEVLKAALAGAERKRQQLELQARYTEQLGRFELPVEFTEHLANLLYKPDRNTLEAKALEAACAATHLSAAHLLQRCGALPSTQDYHLQRFLFEHFPKGTGFPPVELSAWDELPQAGVNAFSIDDAATTEIDDAFSVEKLANGNWRIGVHIAAPTLGLPRDSDGDKIAAQRLSTVYMPGQKITMLPDSVVEAFTLCADRVCPALSMYNEVDAETLELLGHESRVEKIHIAANLRHDTLEPLFNEDTLAAGKLDYPYASELKLLWDLVQKSDGARQAVRQQHAAGGLQLPYRVRRACGRAPEQPRQHHATAARFTDRQGGFRADDPGEQRVGQASCRARLCRHLPHPAERQGQDEHRRRTASGSGRGAIHVVELAAAPLCGHGEPTPDHRDVARRRACLPKERHRAVCHDARLRHHVWHLR
jgi:exoribonuclease-2